MELKRECPSCKSEMVYQTRQHYHYAVQHNVKCQNCKGKYHCKECGVRLQHVKATWTGYCLKCYKNVYLPSVRIVDRKDPSTWQRKCPQCDKDIVFTTWESYYSSVKYDRVCKTFGQGKKERVKCHNCKSELPKENVSGYCQKCYPVHFNRQQQIKKQIKIQLRTYHCLRCNTTRVYGSEERVSKCKEKGHCFTCFSLQKSCIVCNTPFIITDRKSENKKTCSDTCMKKAYNTKTLGKFLEEAKEKHGDRYDYSKVIYTNSVTNVEVGCPSHGSFFISPHNHISGRGCPKCQTSKGERKIIEFLNSVTIPFVYQKSFPDCRGLGGGKLKYDFFLPSKNVLIEYDGEHHYGILKVKKHVLTPEQVKKKFEHDRIKDNYAMLNKIPLIRIPYTQIKNIKTILTRELSLASG